MKKDKQISKCIANINFELIQKIMDHLGWGWVKNSGISLPTIEEIKINLMKQLNESYDGFKKNKYMYTESSGFHIYKFSYGKKNKFRMFVIFGLTEGSSLD